jgi:hypothetical protein
MNVSRVLPVSSRRVWMAFGLAAVLCLASGVRAQPTPGQDPAPAPPPDQLKFNLDVPLLLIYGIKPDRTADFEALWAGIRAGLGKSDKPDLKAFAETLVVFKVDVKIPGQVLYAFHFEHPSKTYSYNPVPLLYDVGGGAATTPTSLFTRDEADALYAKFKDCYISIQPWPLVKVGG